MLPVHQELQSGGGPTVAAYVDLDILTPFIFSRIKNAVTLLSGKAIASGSQTGGLSAILQSADFTPVNPPTAAAPWVPPSGVPSGPGKITLSINGDFAIKLTIVPTNHPDQVISDVQLTLTGIETVVSASADFLSLDDFDFTTTSTITRIDDGTILHEHSIDPVEANRVEGLLGYGVVPSAAKAIFRGTPGIKLSDLYPSVHFEGAVNLAPLSTRNAIGIFPSKISLLQNTVCACAHNGSVKTQPGHVAESGGAPTVGSSVGTVQIGGPIADPNIPLGSRRDGAGPVGLYVPEPVYRQMATATVMPGIVITAKDDGFIGWDARASVGFTNLGVDLDRAKGGILVNIGLDIGITAEATIDIGCGLRGFLGAAIINPRGQSNIQIGLYPALSANGNVMLATALNSVSISDFDVIVIGIGELISLVGGLSWWVGFLIDVILAQIIRVGLPYALRNAIVSAMSQYSWNLIYTVPAINALGVSFDQATYDTSNTGSPINSILISFDRR